MKLKQVMLQNLLQVIQYSLENFRTSLFQYVLKDFANVLLAPGSSSLMLNCKTTNTHFSSLIFIKNIDYQ